ARLRAATEEMMLWSPGGSAEANAKLARARAEFAQAKAEVTPPRPTPPTPPPRFVRQRYVHCAVIVATLGALSTLGLVIEVRRRRRLRSPTLCHTCGYDLRA